MMGLMSMGKTGEIHVSENEKAQNLGALKKYLEDGEAKNCIC